MDLLNPKLHPLLRPLRRNLERALHVHARADLHELAQRRYGGVNDDLKVRRIGPVIEFKGNKQTLALRQDLSGWDCTRFPATPDFLTGLGLAVLAGNSSGFSEVINKAAKTSFCRFRLSFFDDEDKKRKKRKWV
ncbi:hypothetical protein VitviT2T_024232 [Vitis vinifera]|uniref:Uncharacterized protein n=1 Tax=Vitis vinifera TaxID=29760 RepID=A0ABY9DHU0_VITVI|nr:hypothetical protein VitviT2T_024232 [Vitis vinifera]